VYTWEFNCLKKTLNNWKGTLLAVNVCFKDSWGLTLEIDNLPNAYKSYVLAINA
jgi:hypothetical protein